MKRLLCLALLLFPLAAGALQSRLSHSLSPYLRMHAEDPVQWRPWGREALEEARRTGKPIYISSGYFACYWCHVMQRESYRNPEVARLLNQWFVPVKVDRELNPALDEHLIDFVERTRGSAGWPLNVFLTPEGYPMAGMTYLPRDQFEQVLRRFHALWEKQGDLLRGLARKGLDELVSARKREGGGASETVDAARLRRRFVDAALRRADGLDGGFGQQSRFPMAVQLRALLALKGGERKKEVEEFLRLTLRRMAQGGLRDQIAGGFFRYTVDPQWTTPHYEKMLYTQALLALLYLQAAEALHRPAFREVAFDTLDFVVREMRSGEGGYVASFSAVDAEGVEGGGYLWSRGELESLFPPETLKQVLRHWRFPRWRSGEPSLPLAGKSLAEMAADLGVSQEEMKKRAALWRQRLLQARARRRPPVDDKRLAGWNGLLLAALSEASAAPGGQRFRGPAKALAGYLMRVHWTGKRLLRVPSRGEEIVPGSLEDYAYVAWGLERWAAVSGDAAAGRLERELLGSAWRLFHDAAGWRGASESLLPGMPAAPAQEDGALPSPAAVVVGLSLREKEPSMLRQEARKALRLARPRVQSTPFWYASWVVLLAAPEEVGSFKTPGRPAG